MNANVLPSGAWESLFPRALALIDEISKYGGMADPFWTLGGGTVLMFRYRHRMSKDIDIFVPDPQYLGFVTPRLSDTAADMTEDYIEQPGMFVKLQFEEGEVTVCGNVSKPCPASRPRWQLPLTASCTSPASCPPWLAAWSA